MIQKLCNASDIRMCWAYQHKRKINFIYDIKPTYCSRRLSTLCISALKYRHVGLTKGGSPGAVVKTDCFFLSACYVLPACKVGDRGFEPHSGLQVSKKCFFPAHSSKFNIVGRHRDREVACSALDRHGPNFESCVWRAVSSHHHQEVILAKFSIYVYT